MITKKHILNLMQSLTVIVFTLFVAACSSDDATPVSGVSPDNCSTPCMQTTPDLSATTVTAASGDTIIMIITIDGDASLVEPLSSYISLEPVDTSTGQGTLAAATNKVVDTVTNTMTMNFIIPGGSVTGAFYPKININVADTPNPDDPGTGVPNGVLYELDTERSSTNYSYSEIVDGASSTYTSNGIYVGTVATDIVMPLVTLQ